MGRCYRFTTLSDHPTGVQTGPCRDTDGSRVGICEGEGEENSLLLAPRGINGTIAGSAKCPSEFGQLVKKTGTPTATTRSRDTDVKLVGAATTSVSTCPCEIKKRRFVDARRCRLGPGPQAWKRTSSHKDWKPRSVDGSRRHPIGPRGTIYEVEIGTFATRFNPRHRNFSFPGSSRDSLTGISTRRDTREGRDVLHRRDRCEKSDGRILKETRFAKVYHLRGGILNYLEKRARRGIAMAGRVFRFGQSGERRSRAPSGPVFVVPRLAAMGDHGDVDENQTHCTKKAVVFAPRCAGWNHREQTGPPAGATNGQIDQF